MKVTILEAGPRPLLRLDEGLVGALVEYSRTLGIDILTGVEVEQIAEAGDRLTVRYQLGGETTTLEVDRVLNGTGRVANLDDLNLAVAGITVERGRVSLDEHLRSTENPDVYFAGDAITGAPQLSSVATYEGRIVGAHLLGHGSAETVHVFSLAMRHGITATDLKQGYYVYPTFTNDVKFLV